MSLLLGFYAFAIGSIIGSFLNVVVYRWPRGESVVFPASHCPNCNVLIRPYDNIPIVSFLILRGRCRSCRSVISARYPIVELANGLFYLAIWLHAGFSPASLLVAAVTSMSLVLIFIDADVQLLPDVVDLPGIVIGLGIGALGTGAGDLVVSHSLRDSIIGAVAGSALLLAIALGYRLIRGIEGMGYGDVKMLAMIGAVLGWQWLFAVVLIASVSGAIVGVVVIVATGSDFKVALPFGVFLGASLLTILFFGGILSSWLPAFRIIP